MAEYSEQPKRVSRRKKALLTVYEIVIFGMLGALMMVSDLLMNIIPNVHLVGVTIVVLTVVYRWKALFPLYVYVLLIGLSEGIGTWWIPYLYVWTILWGMVMLLPRKMPKVAKCIVYPAVCSVFGFLFGTLFAPGQALMFGLSWKEMLAWIVAGIPFDIIHGISNLFAGMLIFPLSELLLKLTKKLKIN